MLGIVVTLAIFVAVHAGAFLFSYGGLTQKVSSVETSLKEVRDDVKTLLTRK